VTLLSATSMNHAGTLTYTQGRALPNNARLSMVAPQPAPPQQPPQAQQAVQTTQPTHLQQPPHASAPGQIRHPMPMPGAGPQLHSTSLSFTPVHAAHKPPAAPIATASAAAAATPTTATVSGHHGVSSQVSPMLLRRLHSQGSPHHWSSPQIPVVVQLQAPSLGTSATAAVPPGKVHQLHPTEPITGGHTIETSAATDEQLQPPNEALRAEVEALRRSLATQEDIMSRLSNELATTQEHERTLQAQVDAAREELEAVGHELVSEKSSREQAQAALAELQRQYAGPTTPRVTRGSPASEEASREFVKGAGDASYARRGWSSLNTSRGGGKLDEVEPRLREFLEKTACSMDFRQLNRGWYAVRPTHPQAAATDDRYVEVSIVNGKLMVTMEPSTHEPGWNHGKPGPIEKFVAKYAEQ